jgi:hypothetical protein
MATALALSVIGAGDPVLISRTNKHGHVGHHLLKARLSDLGGTPLPSSPTDFGRFIIEETEKWAKVVKFAGINAE